MDWGKIIREGVIILKFDSWISFLRRVKISIVNFDNYTQHSLLWINFLLVNLVGLIRIILRLRNKIILLKFLLYQYWCIIWKYIQILKIIFWGFSRSGMGWTHPWDGQSHFPSLAGMSRRQDMKIISHLVISVELRPRPFSFYDFMMIYCRSKLENFLQGF